MKKIVFGCFAIAALVATSVTDAQNRGNVGGGTSPGAGRGSSVGPFGGGMAAAGGSGYRGGFAGHGGDRGGSWHGGYTGSNHRGGHWHGGYRGYYPYWRGAYWGPSLGFYFGAPAYWAYNYGYPAYAPAYAPVYAESSFYSSPVIVEENNIYVEPQPRASAANYWYYCTDPAGYFPYVKNCSRAWVPVLPQSITTPGSK